MSQTTTKKIVNFFTPYQAQKKIVKACISPDVKYIVYNAARQSGKTMLLANLAVYYALESPNAHIMLVSPTDSMVRKIYKQILNSVIHLPFVKSYRIQAGSSEITFSNGSVILFRSAASTNSLRGYSNSHLLIDEAAYIDEETYNVILAPTLAVKGKKVILCSTPKGKGLFYKLFMEGVNGNPEYKSFKTTYLDNPFANKKFIEEQKKMLNQDIFNQEYEGKFIDAGSLFKNIDNIATLSPSEPKSQDMYFAGVDIGVKADSTCIIILNQKGEMVHMNRFNNTNNAEIINEIKKSLNKYNVAKCLVEGNNQGILIIQQLIAQGMWKVEEFYTTASSKPEIINNLLYAINNGELKLLNDDVLKLEFETFGYSISKSGQIKFAGTKTHDDSVMSTAIANHCLKQNRGSGQFVFM